MTETSRVSRRSRRPAMKLGGVVALAAAAALALSAAWFFFNRQHHRGVYSFFFGTRSNDGPGYPARDPTLPVPTTCDLSTLTNNASWPAVCQFNPKGPWHQKIPGYVIDGGRYAENSSAVIAQLLEKGNWITNYVHVPNISTINPGYDNGGGYPAYVCQVGDKSCARMTVSCGLGRGWCSNDRGTIDGLSIYFPRHAIPENNGQRGADNHVSVLDCVSIAPKCREVNLYNSSTASNPPADGYPEGHVIAVGAGDYSDPVDGDGWGSTSVGGQVTKGGATLFAGLVRSSEIENGIDGIAHAIPLDIGCGKRGVHVFPATDNFDEGCAYQFNAAPAGSRFYWDESCAVIAQRKLDPWSKALLCALHRYGGYAVDTNGFTSITFGEDAEMPFGGVTGYTDYVTPFAMKYGTDLGFAQFGTNTVYAADLTGNLSADEIKAHFHMLDPCVNGNADSQGSCRHGK